jgi:hypothetical protein
MILVVKNNPGSVQNTVYLTPKEKRGAANVAEYGATINGLGMEIKSLTTDKTVMVNARVLTVTDRFTTFVFDAEVPSANTSVDLSGPSWPDVILEEGLGYLTRGLQTGIILTESGDNITTEEPGMLLKEDATATTEAYQETLYESHTDDTSTFTFYE